MATQNAEQQTQSTTELLFGTKQGQMLLLMGLVYTSIVSLSFGMFYFIAGTQLTAAITAGYACLTAVFVYLRAPLRRLVVPGLLVFTVLPIAATVLVIFVFQLFL